MTVEKGSHNVHLVDFPAIMSSDRYDVTNGLPSNSGCKSFLKVNSVNLLIALGNYTSFVDRGRRGMRTEFNLEDSLGGYRMDTQGKWNQFPGRIFDNGLIFRGHGCEGCRRASGRVIGSTPFSIQQIRDLRESKER